MVIADVLCQLASTSSEDSSSCSGESGHLRPGSSGRLRLGVRMGTRRHRPDYTSSSDQSCDTVIYVGSDGCPISDHELTDYEIPPTTTIAQSSDSIVTAGQDGGASGSLARVRGKSATPRSSLSRAISGQHSDGELVTSGRRLRGSFSTKPAWRSPPPPPPKKSAEMWIDGPKSMMTRVEQWVDGPPEFRHADENCSGKVTSETAEQRPLATTYGDDRMTQIIEEVDVHSPVEATTVSTDHDFYVAARSDEKKHEDKVMQSPLRVEQSDVSDGNCTTNISDLQFTVVEVHQSADGDSKFTEISSTVDVQSSPEHVVEENHRMSTDSAEVPCVERRDVAGRSKLDIDALLLANRESIYELQMDEELETGSRESLLQLVCGSDDDWSTCGTEPRLSKCRESDNFRDVDACMKDLDNMVITSSEVSELKTSIDAEKSADRQQENEEETTTVNVASDLAPQLVWIRTRDINESITNRVDSNTPDHNFTEVPTTFISKTESAAVATPTNRSRHSALPVPMSSCPSRVRRKPPPIPVRSSSVSQSADRSTDGRVTSTSIAVTSTPPETFSNVIHQKTLSDSKNGSASHGFCSRDCSAAREAEVATGTSTVATTNAPRCGGVVTAATAVVDAKPPVSGPPATTKSRSRIALPCRRDKKTNHQPEMSALSPSRTTTSLSLSPATASRDGRAAMALVSPYHSVTKPRTSKGADSDNSSSVLSSVSTSRIQMSSAAHRRGSSARGTRSEVETSSGYESMIRDSEEIAGTSSASECQSPFRLKANKMFRKKGLLTGFGCCVIFVYLLASI